MKKGSVESSLNHAGHRTPPLYMGYDERCPMGTPVSHWATEDDSTPESRDWATCRHGPRSVCPNTILTAQEWVCRAAIIDIHLSCLLNSDKVGGSVASGFSNPPEPWRPGCGAPVEMSCLAGCPGDCVSPHCPHVCHWHLRQREIQAAGALPLLGCCSGTGLRLD